MERFSLRLSGGALRMSIVLFILGLLLYACRPAPQPMPTFTLAAIQVSLTFTPQLTATFTSVPPTITPIRVPPTATPTPAVTPTPKPYAVLQGPTNIRDGPGTNYPIISSGDQGDIFYLTGISADLEGRKWFEMGDVDHDGDPDFIAGWVVEAHGIRDLPLIEPPPTPTLPLGVEAAKPLSPEQRRFLVNLRKYHGGYIPPDQYEPKAIQLALTCVEKYPVFGSLIPQGYDLLIKVMSEFEPRMVYKYHMLFCASILQCQNFFYKVDTMDPSAYGLLRNNKLDPEEWSLYKDRMSYLIKTNEKGEFIVDLSNLSGIIKDPEAQLLYLRQVSFGPDMLLNACNQTTWYPQLPGGYKGGLVCYDNWTGNTTWDFQTLKRSIEEDKRFHDALFNHVRNLKYDDAYFAIVQQADNFEVYDKLVCYGHAYLETKAFRSVGGAAFPFELFYPCDCKDCGYWDPIAGKSVYGYCTHYDSGYMASDEVIQALVSNDVLSYRNIYCPQILVENPTHDKLLAADCHLLSVYIPGRRETKHISPVPHPSPWKSTEVLRDQAFLTNE